MKTTILLGLAAAMSMALVNSASAASIGVSFLGRNANTRVLPTETAGVVPQANWNNIDDSTYSPAENGTAVSLQDDAGKFTTVSLTFVANDSWNSDGPDVTPNDRLMLGIIKRQGLNTACTFTFSNLDVGPYDVYVYTSMNGDNVMLDTTIGSTTYYTFEDHQFAGTFIQAVNTSAAGTRDVGNYVKFAGVRPTNGVFLTTATWRGGGDGNGIAGFQIVGAGAFPSNTRPVAITRQPASRRTLTNQTVTFSVGTDVPANFQWFKGGAAISGANNATFQTAPLTPSDNGTSYYVVVSNNVNSVQSSNAVITIGNLVLVPGAKQEFFDNALRADVEAGGLTPDSITPLSLFETPTDQSDTFTVRLSALFKPPVTGNYVFFVCSDDDSDLFLSTDASPANKRQIAAENGWSGVRNWNGANGAGGLTGPQAIAQKRSDKWIPDPVGDPTATPPFANGIPLVAGNTYYLEGVAHEGGGGDNLAATFILVGDPNPVNGDAPKFAGFLLAPYVQALDGAYISVTNPPANVSVVQNRTATFSVGATSGYIGDTSGVGPAIAYQWQSAAANSSSFVNIPNALGRT
jgi:hypothetical protein